MSKVLIDRELLERAVYRLELAYDADTPIVCDLSSVLSAPSGTPAMPVKAYYHEAPNEYGGLNKSVGLEVRKEFTDAPLVLESDALARIACIEGEIAKRDEELAACRVAVENCDVFRARIAELEARIVWLECEEQVNASPAAPAADAGIVDMYRHLQKVTPYRFKKIQDASVTDGGDVLYFHKDRFDAALLDDIAAHRAKGVV